MESNPKDQKFSSKYINKILKRSHGTVDKMSNITENYGHRRRTLLLPLSPSRLLTASIFFVCTFFHTTPVSANQACISNIQDIYAVERAVDDTSVSRTYVVCPNRRYKIAALDYFGQKLLRTSQGKGNDENPPLPLRPNVKIQCGNDATKASPSCFIDSGDLQVDGTATRGLGKKKLGNVEIVGFVFENAGKNSVVVTKPGSVTFRNCEWKSMNTTDGAIVLDYYDRFPGKNRLVVSFEDCRIHENEYSGEPGARTALIVGNSDQTRLVFQRSIFENNNMIKEKQTITSDGITISNARTHLIESLGSTEIRDSCFANNKVAAANVAVYHDKLTASGVSVNGGVAGEGVLCKFAAVFKTEEQYRNGKPSCVSADSSSSATTCKKLSAPKPSFNNGGGGGGGGNGGSNNGPDNDSPVIDPVNQYVPFMISALKYDSFFEIDDARQQGGCSREEPRLPNEPDAQKNPPEDSVCLEYGECHISHTLPGEYLIYRFAYDKYAYNDGDDDEILVDVSVRISSSRMKQFRLELLYYDGNDNEQEVVEASKLLYSDGLGYKEFSTVTWKNVKLRPDAVSHSIRFVFVQGNINFCALGVEFSDPQKKTTPPLPTAAPSYIAVDPTTTPSYIDVVPTLAPDDDDKNGDDDVIDDDDVSELYDDDELATKEPTTDDTTNDDDDKIVVLVDDDDDTNDDKPTPTIPTPPYTWEALDYDGAYEVSPSRSAGGCNKDRDDGVDAQPTADGTCRDRDGSECNIGWWEPGEYLTYDFVIPETANTNNDGGNYYDIRVRAAAWTSGKDVLLSLATASGKNGSKNHNGSPFFLTDVPPSGSQTFEDIVWESVYLEPDTYSLKVESTTGKINLCSVAVLLADDNGDGNDDDTTNDDDDDTTRPPENNDDDDNPNNNNDFLVAVPGIYSALYYSAVESFDITTGSRGNCPFRKDTAVSAKINNDPVCNQAIAKYDRHCNIAFTEPTEYLIYDFENNNIDQQDSIKVSLRVASKGNRNLLVELFSVDMARIASKVVQVRGSGSWDAYKTLVVWENVNLKEEKENEGERERERYYKLKIKFLDGMVNLCSFGIE